MYPRGWYWAHRWGYPKGDWTQSSAAGSSWSYFRQRNWSSQCPEGHYSFKDSNSMIQGCVAAQSQCWPWPQAAKLCQEWFSFFFSLQCGFFLLNICSFIHYWLRFFFLQVSERINLTRFWASTYLQMLAFALETVSLQCCSLDGPAVKNCRSVTWAKYPLFLSLCVVLVSFVLLSKGQWI